jgi:hypothetical protein
MTDLGRGTTSDINNLGHVVGNNRDGEAVIWSFAIRPATPYEELDILRTMIEGVGLENGLANALQVKLDAAARQLDRGNTPGVLGPLGAFINLVSAWMDDPPALLTEEQGASLIEAVQHAIDQLTS